MTPAAAALPLVKSGTEERSLALPSVRRGSYGGLLVRLARGEALERMRRPAFLVALAFMIYAAYVYLPHAGSSYLTVDIHGHRPRYNSAGVGGMLALLANTFIGLAGFYLVRGAIQRDRETGVGAVLAATPLTRLAYLLSKLLSGFAVLASMMAMLWLAGGVLQLILGEDRRLDLVALLQPLLLFCLPAMLMVAAVAVAFDSWPLFRGGFGNVAYFILWMARWLALVSPRARSARSRIRTAPTPSSAASSPARAPERLQPRFRISRFRWASTCSARDSTSGRS